MNKTSLILFAMVTLSSFALAKSLNLKTLPAPVQKTISETLKGGEIKNISKETEKGVTFYEVESMLNGKHRDFNIDVKGVLIVVEQEVKANSPTSRLVNDGRDVFPDNGRASSRYPPG